MAPNIHQPRSEARRNRPLGKRRGSDTFCCFAFIQCVVCEAEKEIAKKEEEEEEEEEEARKKKRKRKKKRQ